jgi:hypothetical protein
MGLRTLETSEIQVELPRAGARPSPILLRLWEDARRSVSSRVSPSPPPARRTQPAEKSPTVSYSHD